MADSNRDPKNQRDQGAGKETAPGPDFKIPRPQKGSGIGGGSGLRRPRERGSLPVFGGANWIILWFIITLGVASGNLLSGFIGSLALGYQLRAVLSSLNEGADETAAQVQSDLQESSERRAAEQRERRRESDRGQTLARQCDEWRSAHNELDTYTTEQNMDRYCGAYHEYVQTGRVSID